MAATKEMLNLATATKTTLPRLADVVSDEMTALGYKACENVKIAGKTYEASSHFMDMFAYATTRANLNTEQLHESMKYLAPIAKQFGMTGHEAMSTVMVAANNAVKGSMSGTAFRTGLLRIIAPPKMAKEGLDDLGLSASDATKQMQEARAAMGNMGLNLSKTDAMNDMEKFSYLTGEMHKKFQTMSGDERLSYINAIFGKNAASGWAAFFDQYEQFLEYKGDMDSGIEGWATDTAGVMRDNTKTIEEYFKSAADAAQRSVGQILKPAYEEGLKVATKFADGLQSFVVANPRVVQAAAGIAASIAAVTVAAAGVQLAFAGWNMISASAAVASDAFVAFKSKIITNAVAVQGQLAALRASMMSFWASIQAQGLFTTLSTAARSLGTALVGALGPATLIMAGLALAGYYVCQNWEKVASVFENIGNKIASIFSGTADNLSPSLDRLFESLQRLAPVAENLGAVFFAVFATVANAIVNTIAAAVNIAGSLIKTIVDVATGIGNVIASVLAGDISTAFEHLKSTALNFVTDIANTIKDVFVGIFEIFDGLSKPLEWMGLINQPAETPSPVTISETAPTAVLGDNVIDTSAVENSLGEVSNSANTAASAIAEVAPAVENLTQGTQECCQNLQNTQVLSESLQNIEGVVNQLKTAIEATSQQFPTLDSAIQTSNPQVQSLGETSANAVASVQNLGSAADGAKGGISGLGDAAGAVALALQSKATEISNIKISIPQVTTTPVAANYSGGIYPKGAFLTTFAEKSAEAAIPLDKSQRAVDLWTRAGQMLGLLPGKSAVDKPDTSQALSQFSQIQNIVNKIPEPEYDELGNIKGVKTLADNIITQDDDIQVTRAKKLQQLEDYYKVKRSTGGQVESKLPSLSIPNLKMPNQAVTQTLPSQFSLPKMPQMPNLPQLGNIFSGITLPKVEDLIKLPKFDDVLKLPKLDEMIKLPKINDLIKLPKIDDMVKLPKFGDLIKLPNLGREVTQTISPSIEEGQLSRAATTLNQSTANDFSQAPGLDLHFTINIQGNANAAEVKEGVEMAIPQIRASFEEQMAAYQHEQMRRSYA